MKKLIVILLSLCLSIVAFAQRETVYDGEYWQDQPLPGWETAARDRIEIMGNIKWTTMAPMPKCFHTKDAMFEAYEERTGIPYSAVHDFCGYVGKDISFYTFLSAVNNARSSMYLVNYHLLPYDRAKAGPFYGTVCSATVNYVWGVPMMTFCRFIRGGDQSHYLQDLGQDIDVISLYDGFCYGGPGGHIVVVCGIGRDRDGKVQQIRTFEGTGPVNRFRNYTREQFQEKMIAKTDGHFYRYDHETWAPLISLPEYIEKAPLNDVRFNTDLSPEDGERLTYPEGKVVKIDILSRKYKTLEVYRDGGLYGKYDVKGKDIFALENLPEGLYTAQLSTPKKTSAPVEFQVAQAECKAWYGEDGQLYVGGCRDGVHPIGAYMAPGDKVNKNYSSYPIAHLCVPCGDGVWKLVPNLPRGKAKTLKVNLAGKYSGYWAKIINLQ